MNKIKRFVFVGERPIHLNLRHLIGLIPNPLDLTPLSTAHASHYPSGPIEPNKQKSQHTLIVELQI